jgi:sulfur-oxidizing protein SoxY
MNLTRRQTLALSVGAAAFAAAASLRAGPAWADAAATEARMMDFTGGKAPEPGKVTLTAPEIAENGNTVPISVSVDAPVSGGVHVTQIMILAEDNPNPGVVTFNFTPLSGEASAATRMRLARTQKVIAVAKMSDGSALMDAKLVKVTIGGCGG